MENKHNFTGIIIPVIVAVILLTVLPIINSINEECPPCEECPSYNIGNLEVNPNFSSGDYIVDKNDYDYLDNITIVKDDNLIPENIKKDVDIFGVVGTFEGGSESGIVKFDLDGISQDTKQYITVSYTFYTNELVIIGSETTITENSEINIPSNARQIKIKLVTSIAILGSMSLYEPFHNVLQTFSGLPDTYEVMLDYLTGDSFGIRFNAMPD